MQHLIQLRFLTPIRGVVIKISDSITQEIRGPPHTKKAAAILVVIAARAVRFSGNV